MFLQVEETTTAVFTGTLSTTEDREALRSNGFVHVLGLRAHHSVDRHRTRDDYVIGAKLSADEVGKWDTNNGKIVLITTGGEVWLRATIGSLDIILGLCKRLCPKGKGAFVPLSSGEEVSNHNLLKRVVNPYDNLNVPAR